MEKSSTGAGAGAGAGAATGCYKCGRPGHWSRDCPLSATTNPNPNPSSNSNLNSSSNTNFSRPSFKSGGSGSGGGGGSSIKPPFEKTEKPKKVPRRIPKLTSELLLSNDGLGYILRHFPRSFKCRGRGHEVKDLENLIGLYSQWHSHLLPYYPFEQFIHKVEQVGASKRVKTCIKDLRERVANGGDPSKLHEPPVEHDVPPYEPEETNNVEQPSWDMGDLPSEKHDADAMQEVMQEDVQEDMQEDVQEDMQEEMPDEIYKSATAEPCESSQRQVDATAPVLPGNNSVNESSNPVSDNGESGSSKMEVTDDQKARMEASRLKALERAAARARLAKAD